MMQISLKHDADITAARYRYHWSMMQISL